ncbi:MAG: hypothetical protein KAI91_05575, partial [Candidatus Omnitrophica bacterium]|nr:hypothetical protein [Candidatus Omnitrophota bacterium]
LGRDKNDGGKESLILMMEGVSILLVGMIVIISGTSKKSSRETFKDTLSDEEEFKEAFRIIWEKIVKISASKYRVPSVKSLGGRKGVDIVMSEYTRSRREGLSDLQAIRELIIEELNKGSEQQQIAEKIKPILKTAAIGMMNGGLEEYSSSLLVLFHNTEKFVKKAAEMVRKEEFSSKDGGNNIKINKFFDLPIDLLNIVLLGLTNITIKEVKSFADMPLAKGNNLFGLKSTLNSTIMRKNIDIIDSFRKWLAMRITSPPGGYKIIKLPATKTQSYQLSEFSYLLYLINTILNITPVNTNRIAISHSVRLGYRINGEVSIVDTWDYINKAAKGFYVVSYDSLKRVFAVLFNFYSYLNRITKKKKGGAICYRKILSLIIFWYQSRKELSIFPVRMLKTEFSFIAYMTGGRLKHTITRAVGILSIRSFLEKSLNLLMNILTKALLIAREIFLWSLLTKMACDGQNQKVSFVAGNTLVDGGRIIDEVWSVRDKIGNIVFLKERGFNHIRSRHQGDFGKCFGENINDKSFFIRIILESIERGYCRKDKNGDFLY